VIQPLIYEKAEIKFDQVFFAVRKVIASVINVWQKNTVIAELPLLWTLDVGTVCYNLHLKPTRD
jgi:hypothetical protein